MCRVRAWLDAAERRASGRTVTELDWERILEVAPDHPQADSIRQGIAAAYSELGEPVPSDVLSGG